jgi:hypothetical protein
MIPTSHQKTAGFLPRHARALAKREDVNIAFQPHMYLCIFGQRSSHHTSTHNPTTFLLLLLTILAGPSIFFLATLAYKLVAYNVRPKLNGECPQFNRHCCCTALTTGSGSWLIRVTRVTGGSHNTADSTLSCLRCIMLHKGGKSYSYQDHRRSP